MKDFSELIIVGGGISGLVAAFYAQKAGIDFLLLETEEKLGGSMQTVFLTDGKIAELGPNAMRAGETLDEIIKDLNLEKLNYSKKIKKAQIFCEKKLLSAFNVLSFKSKLNILFEILKPANSPNKAEADESIESFFARRFGQEFVDKLIWAIVTGIYAGDLSKLSIKSIFPNFYKAERNYGGLIRGLIASYIKKEFNVKRKMNSFNGGLDEFTEALKNKITNNLCLNSPVQKISKIFDSQENYFQVQVNNKILTCKKIVLAVPSYIAAKLCPELLPNEIINALLSIEYIPNVSATCLLQKDILKSAGLEKLLENSIGFLSSRFSDTKLLGAVYSSNLFSNRAKEDEFAMTCFLGGVKSPETISLDNSSIERLLKEELAKILNSYTQKTNINISYISPESISVKCLKKWEKALPQYYVGHTELIKKIKASLPEGLKLAGNYINGAGLEDCAITSKQAIDELYL